METITVKLGRRSYDIAIGNSTLGVLGEAIKALPEAGLKVALITNPTVHALYGDRAEDSLNAAGFEVLSVKVPDGEQYKSQLWIDNILTGMLRHGMDRGSTVVALGGGVIGDMAGFAASVFMRGIRYVQVPTTLLAQVDSSVGGKTGVNHPLGKNLIGSFWQPALVWIDVATLNSLPRRELLAGIAEVIKYGVIWDSGFFDFLGQNIDNMLGLQPEALTEVVRRSCRIKAEVVSADEREAGQRAILNFGHTVGHAIEAVAGYGELLHGEALAIGMLVESRLAEQELSTPTAVTRAIKKVLAAYGLPIELPPGAGANELLSAMALDKKTLGGVLRFTLPVRIGTVKYNVEVAADAVTEALETN